jgi:hypothetical protein
MLERASYFRVDEFQMTARDIFYREAFQKAWLIASVTVGVAGIASGILEIVFGHDGGRAGIAGGTVVFAIGCAGLWALHRQNSRKRTGARPV